MISEKALSKLREVTSMMVELPGRKPRYLLANSKVCRDLSRVFARTPFETM